MNIRTFVFNPFQVNTYLLFNKSGKCIIVDPAMNNPHEEKEIEDFIDNNGLVPEAIINTHCHVDHVLGCNFLKSRYNLPFYIHELEQRTLDAAMDYGLFFGLEVKHTPVADKYIREGEDFIFDGSKLKILHVPGHSEGSIALLSEDDKMIITGDVLFAGSIGRTDLPGGNYPTIMKSIREKIMILPNDTEVFPGHGPKTTIQNEYDKNPFLQDRY